jgi:hypothetical protein
MKGKALVRQDMSEHAKVKEFQRRLRKHRRMVGPWTSECPNLVLFTAVTLLQHQGMPELHLGLEQYSEPYHVQSVDFL